MKRLSAIAAASTALAVVFGCAVPAYAQYQNQFSLAKVVKQGKTSKPIAGTGVVKIQVQVNADGSHKVVRVLSSTNPGDNAAAMEIAQTSTYRPAHKGSTPVTSFYDYELRFTGKSVNAWQEANAGVTGGGPAAEQVDALIRGGKYSEAVSKAQSALLSSPGNPQLLQLLGVAQYYDKDFTGSAQSFSRVQTVSPQFKTLAAQAFAAAAVKVSSQDPSQSLTYAQKAKELDNGSNSQFALGVAQIANKQYTDAIANLKAVREKSTDPKIKVAVDRQLLTAYLATNDTADANATAAEMKQLDPTGASAAAAIANHYLQAGSDALNAGKYDEALKNFQQAAASGDSQAAVTANTYAALAIFKMSKPDYQQAKTYADKAVAGNPNDPMANFAEGIAYEGIYANSRSSSDRQQALNYLNKADQLAKAAGNTGLSLQIEQQLKNIPQ
jgi:tetratricopeptide (TPR) repeat protein